MGFSISKKTVKHIGKLNNNNSKDEYSSVLLPSNCDFGGIEDIDGNQIGKLTEGQSAKFLVKTSLLIDDKFNENNYFVSIPDDSTIYKIDIDLGPTEELLEDGRNKHNYTTISNMRVDALKVAMKGDPWVTFTISKNQLNEYQTNEGTNRGSILIPVQGEKYASGRVSVNMSQISEIKNHDNILKVSIPENGSFTITRSKIEGQNEQGENVYGENEVLGTVKGAELVKFFEKPASPQQEQQKNVDNVENQEQAEEQDEVQEDDIQF